MTAVELLAAVPARAEFDGRPAGVLVEPVAGPAGGTLVALVPLDEHGRAHGDGVVLDVAAAADLAARVRALVDAGRCW